MASDHMWQLTVSSLADENEYLLNNGLYTDCTFLVGEDKQEINCHKLLLAKSSTVFAAMLYGSLKEDNIHVTDIEFQTFLDLVRFMYTRKWEPNKLGYIRILALCYAAKKYMVHTAVTVTITYLISEVTPSNVCHTLELANLVDIPELRDKCMDIICQETKLVISDPNFLEAERSTVEIILKCHSLNIDSEIELIEALCKWGNANKPEGIPLQEYLDRSIISLIRFLTIDITKLIACMKKLNFTSDGDKLIILEAIGLKDKMLLKENQLYSCQLVRKNPVKFKQNYKLLFPSDRMDTKYKYIVDIKSDKPVKLHGIEIICPNLRAFKFGREEMSTRENRILTIKYKNEEVTATFDNLTLTKRFVRFVKAIRLKTCVAKLVFEFPCDYQWEGRLFERSVIDKMLFANEWYRFETGDEKRIQSYVYTLL